VAPADPIPRALTFAGLAMSAAAWTYGCLVVLRAPVPYSWVVQR